VILTQRRTRRQHDVGVDRVWHPDVQGLCFLPVCALSLFLTNLICVLAPLWLSLASYVMSDDIASIEDPVTQLRPHNPYLQ
jgi:hypothetical protein